MESLTKDELVSLLRAAKANRERDWLMMLVGLWHGLRASEVVNLKRDDVQDGYITVQRGKKSLKTTQPLIRHEDPLLDEHSAFFDLTLKMESNQRLFNLGRKHFWRLFQGYCKIAGIPRHKAHPHVLKHSIAMQTIQSMGVEYVRQLLGHRSLASTGEYLRVSDEQTGGKLRSFATVFKVSLTCSRFDFDRKRRETMENSPSLLGLITRINHAATDIRKRTASVADILGGGRPKGEGQSSTPDPCDLHSQLQRILTKLECIHDNLDRIERVTGVVTPEGVQAQDEECVPYTTESQVNNIGSCSNPVSLPRRY